MSKNHKNNAGYIHNKRDTTNVTEYLEEMKGLPFGIYRYDNLGEILLKIRNINLISRYFVDEEEMKQVKGFLIIEKYNIPSRFKFILDQKKDSKINIVYAYIDDNNEILISDTMTGSNKYISYKQLKEIGFNSTTSLIYNERYIGKTFILTHILPFSLFYNDILYLSNSLYNRRTDDTYRYNNGMNVNWDIATEYKMFYIPNNNRNRTLINTINANKLK